MRDSAIRHWPVLVPWGAALLALSTAACGQEIAGTGNPADGGGATGGTSGLNGGGSNSNAGSGGSLPPPVAEAGVDPGRVGIHRLNNTEYDNTVRDLLGNTSRPAKDFLAEEGLSFDNTAAALGMTGPQYEAYFGAARALLDDPAAAAHYMGACMPAAADDACANKIITDFGFKVYRRNLAPEEVARAMKAYNAEFARSQSGAEAIKLALRAMLSAANFLYRIEYDAKPASTEVHSLTSFELASRLSYLVWSTMPDDALFDLARRDALLDKDTLVAQVDHMLDDTTGKADSFIESFGGQWLDLRKIPTHSITPTVFTTYTNSLADAMVAEGQAWFREFSVGNRPLSEWFTADVNFVTDELAQHYGMGPQGAGTQLKRVEITTDNRRGFLGLASFLTHTSFPSRTSPTLRGVWVLSELLCDPPPPPPANVPKLEDSATPEEMTQPAGAENVKERLARHRADPACASCHKVLDPIGLGLERYDGIGRYRETYGNGDPIDPAGVLPGGTAFAGPDELGALVGQDPRFSACVESKLYTYALGREVEDLDAATLEKVRAGWTARGPLTIRNLMKEVVASDAFRFRRGEAQ